MTGFSIKILDGRDQATRPDNAAASLDIDFSVLLPKTPEAIRKDTLAMDNRSGTSRVRGWFYPGQVEVPLINEAQLPFILDMLESMKYGIANPLTIDAVGVPGRDDTFTCYSPDKSIILNDLQCAQWSLSFSYIEIQ